MNENGLFETRLEGLAGLCRDWRTSELFKETMQELVNEVGSEVSGDPILIIKRVKELRSLIIKQERWLLNQREGLTGRVRWIP